MPGRIDCGAHIGCNDDTEGRTEEFKVGLGTEDSKDLEGLCIQARVQESLLSLAELTWDQGLSQVHCS